MIMIRISTKMRVDNRSPIDGMDMGKHADTAVVAAEQRKKKQRRIFPHISHILVLGRQIYEKNAYGNTISGEPYALSVIYLSVFQTDITP
jgi:hypothetical protein